MEAVNQADFKWHSYRQSYDPIVQSSTLRKMMENVSSIENEFRFLQLMCEEHKLDRFGSKFGRGKK